MMSDLDTWQPQAPEPVTVQERVAWRAAHQPRQYARSSQLRCTACKAPWRCTVVRLLDTVDDLEDWAVLLDAVL